MSKYWNNMEIFKKYKKNDNTLFLSQKRPAFFVKRDYTVLTSSKYLYSDTELLKLSNFYSKKYKVGSSNIQQISLTDLKRFLNLYMEILTISRDKELTGSIISIYTPITIQTELDKTTIQTSERFNKVKTEKSIMFACASYLILDEKNRGKGLGMALIQESLQKLYDHGGLGAYFINSVSRCDNSIPLNVWYYPLNLEKLDECKYDYPRDYKSHFLKNMSGDFNVIKVVQENSKFAYEFYFNWMSKKIFYFSPNYEYWQKWIISFPTYIVYSEENIIGLYSFDSCNIRYPINQQNILTGKLLFCLGDVLKAVLSTAKNLFDILELYETGDLNERYLKSVFAQKAYKKHINFFNTRIALKSSDFFAPLF